MVGDVISAALFVSFLTFVLVAIGSAVADQRRYGPGCCCEFCGRPLDVADALTDEGVPYCSLRCWDFDHPLDFGEEDTRELHD